MFVTFSLPEFYLKKQMYTSWAFHVHDRSESSSTYEMIMNQDLLGKLGNIMNFNDHKVTWDTDTIPIKYRDTALYHQ
jgi:xylose isomerase